MGHMTALPGVSRLTRLAELYRLVRDSGVFDKRWYRAQPGAPRWTPNPVIHYATVGWRRGLNPSPRFDTQSYWNRYRDVRELNANPLIHYLLHGVKEGRLATETGKEMRRGQISAATPLPLFTVPSPGTPRLSVVIDDHTPRGIGVGFAHIVGLAAEVASQRGGMLRFILRSETITRTDIADALDASGASRPALDTVLRSPGPTADVETVDGETWWATSATSYESLRPFVPSSDLTWLMTAHEAERYPAGEAKKLVRTLLADPDVATIVLGRDLADLAQPAGPTTVITDLPRVVRLDPPASGSSTIGVLIDDTNPDCLVGSTLDLIERALLGGILSPESWTIALIGSRQKPLTLSQSVVPELRPASRVTEWAREVSRCRVVVSLGAGTMRAFLADAAAESGAATVVVDSMRPDRDELLEELQAALGTDGGKRRKSSPAAPDWSGALKSLGIGSAHS
jgi:hypothetical protein